MLSLRVPVLHVLAPSFIGLTCERFHSQKEAVAAPFCAATRRNGANDPFVLPKRMRITDIKES